MPPKTATASRKDAPIRRSRGFDRSRKKPARKRHKINLKGWLKTPADWARFDAWAKINALPRKIPEPEVIVRPAKPLSQLRRRIQFLSQPRKPHDPGINCRLDLSISRAALNAVATRRTIRLGWPNVRMIDFGREFPAKITAATLNYQASPRIIELSKPRIVKPEECKSFEVSRSALNHKTTERERKMALAKKLVDCPGGMTEEEMDELFTPAGTRRSALTYKLTPWMILLSLPAYKTLMHRKDENAMTWKKMILEEGDERGKQALEEQRKRRQEELRRERKRKYEEMKDDTDDEDDSEEDDEDEDTEDEDGTEDETETEEEDKKKTVKRKRKGTVKGEKQESSKEKDEKEERRAKKRKIEKNAWRFEPPPCKEDPYRISEATLTATGSPRMEELAKPRIYKNVTCRENAFDVRKGALTYTASGRVEDLAKPTRPRSPVERRPPREKDQYGKPIFEMPAYGKVLPKTKPYKMGDCNPPEKKKVTRKRPIDPIVYEPSIDPCIYPREAKIQKRERKRVEKVLQKKAARRRRLKKRRQLGTKKDDDPRDAETAEAEEKGDDRGEAREDRDEEREPIPEATEPEETTEPEEPEPTPEAPEPDETESIPETDAAAEPEETEE